MYIKSEIAECFLQGIGLGVGRYKLWFVQYTNHYAFGESPQKMEPVCVCVFVPTKSYFGDKFVPKSELNLTKSPKTSLWGCPHL